MPAQMRFNLGTFSAAGGPPFPGLVVEERVIALTAVQNAVRRQGTQLSGAESMLALLEDWASNLQVLKGIANALAAGELSDLSALSSDVTKLRVHPPVQSRQIICAGANYRRHVIELIVDHAAGVDPALSKEDRRAHGERLMDHRASHGKPYVFGALASSQIGPNDPITLPYDVTEPDWELELAAIIAKPARRVDRTQALDYVAGYTIVNDITSRELVERPDIPRMGMDWVGSKNAPGFLPTGPYLVPAEFVGDPQAQRIELKLNGKIMQNAGTDDMIFPVARLIEYISNHVQLLPGDLICTGSPSGNGTHYGRFLRPGDVIEAEIRGLGRQRNECLAEPRPSDARAIERAKAFVE